MPVSSRERRSVQNVQFLLLQIKEQARSRVELWSMELVAQGTPLFACTDLLERDKLSRQETRLRE